MYSRHLNRKTILCIACCLATIAIFTSCSEDKPSSPTATPQAVFDEQADCSAVSPENCSKPAFLRLAGGVHVGCPKFEYKVVVRNNLGIPLSGILVSVEWENADYFRYMIPSYQPGVDSYTLNPNGLHRFVKTTNAAGEAKFWIRGSYWGGYPDECTASIDDFGKAKVYACAALIGPTTPSTPDTDNNGIINSADQSNFLKDLFCQPVGGAKTYYYARSDFNGSHSINSADLSVMLGMIFSPCGP